MDRKAKVLSLFLLLLSNFSFAQKIKGEVYGVDKQVIPYVKIYSSVQKTQTDFNGVFELEVLKNDTLFVKHFQYQDTAILISQLNDKAIIVLKNKIKELDEAKIYQKRLNSFDIGYLPTIKGVQIANGTNSIISVESQAGAKSTSNPRELFAKVPGLNIWESDGAGIQMGVGGRGLSPNRAANFNTRQNGYDISADALGYPESYYTPPVEALSSIEIIRGSASLQYGTQFGGLMNFVLKEPSTKAINFTTRLTYGSFNYLGTFNRVSGTKNRFQYQVYHQLKKGDGYRSNSDFTQHQLFAQVAYYLNEKAKWTLEYTKMNYLAQQTGGLTDAMYAIDHRQSVRNRNWFSVDWNIIASHLTIDLSSKTTFNTRAFYMHSNRKSLGFLGKINQADLGGNRELIAGFFDNMGIESRLLKRYDINWKDKKIKSAFLIGLRAYRGTTQSDQGIASDGDTKDFNFLNPRNLEYSSYNFPSQNASFFTDNIFFLNDKWSANIGFRMEYIASEAAGFYKRYAIHPLNLDTLGIYKIEDTSAVSRFVPLLGAGTTYRLNKSVSIYANYCMNYRAVNFNDIRIVNPNVIVDTMIRDEYGATSEIGFRGLIKPFWYIDLAGFYLFYGDKIGLAPEPNGINKIRTNIGDAINLGLEFYTEIDWLKISTSENKKAFTSFVNFSYINSRIINSKEPNYIGKQLEYVSPIMFRSGLKYQTEKFQTQVQFSYNHKQFSDASNAIEASSDAVIGLIPSYKVLDFSCRYQFNKYFQLETGINNLLNEKYFTRRATAYPGPGIMPSDGRSFYVTVQVSL